MPECSNPHPASPAHGQADDQAKSANEIIREIDQAEGDDGVGMMAEDAGSRKPSKTTRQSPATRSSPPQTPENQRKTVQSRVISRVWDTKVGHNDPSKMDLTLSKQTEYLSPMWVTKVGHKRWPRGLSLRGSIYQFRVRVENPIGRGIKRFERNWASIF